MLRPVLTDAPPRAGLTLGPCDVRRQSPPSTNPKGRTVKLELSIYSHDADATADPAGVAIDALGRVAALLESSRGSAGAMVAGTLRDGNGNRIGTWSLS